MERIRDTVRSYLLQESLEDLPAEALQDSTPLVSAGLLDSLAALRLIDFLEQRYKVEVEAHEMTVETLDTLLDIEKLVRAKLDGR
jgi:acyl carrier protein